ncbi:ester cyclase [Streptomyces cucumeris]|uniref:ester cyclase n=1 Tax=Streptomyces cucumeris TaxID=2962890 RepID=UPI003D723B64
MNTETAPTLTALVKEYRRAHNVNDMDLLDAVVAADVVLHTTVQGLPPGIEGAKQGHHLMHGAFPDVHVTIEEVHEINDRVFERYTVTGTHTGPLGPIPPTGRSFKITGMSAFRCQGGKIAEYWSEADMFGLYAQLGLLPPLDGAA